MYYFLLDKLQRLLLVLISGKARKTFGDCWPKPLFFVQDTESGAHSGKKSPFRICYPFFLYLIRQIHKYIKPKIFPFIPGCRRALS